MSVLTLAGLAVLAILTILTMVLVVVDTDRRHRASLARAIREHEAIYDATEEATQ